MESGRLEGIKKERRKDPQSEAPAGTEEDGPRSTSGTEEQVSPPLPDPTRPGSDAPPEGVPHWS